MRSMAILPVWAPSAILSRHDPDEAGLPASAPPSAMLSTVLKVGESYSSKTTPRALSSMTSLTMSPTTKASWV